MKKRWDLLETLHRSTPRNYLERVTSHDKAQCAEIAGRFEKDYWDGDRSTGYGGYHYDGRWLPVAQRVVEHYGLKPGHRVLDVGCGKGFLLFELTRACPGLEVVGIDISRYAQENAKPEVRSCITHGRASELPFPDKSFDFVISLNTLHNLLHPDLARALQEMERVAKGENYLTVESYRTDREKVNLLYWQLTCRIFMTPEEWCWMFEQSGYKGDYGFIFFE